MVGAGPSIIRASIMVEAAIIAKLAGRKNDFYNSLALSVLLILLFDPSSLFDMGFQLSFLGTWALFYIAPAIEESISPALPRFLANPFSISAAPYLATMPVILHNFGQVSFISIIANLFVIPWMEVAVMLGFISSIVGIIFLPLSFAIGGTLTVVLQLINFAVGFFASLPFSCRYFKPPGLLAIAFYYAVLAGGVEAMKGNIKINKIVSRKISLVAIALFAVFLFCAGSRATSELSVTSIDVGQGDSELIESPSGRIVLIDGGGKQFNEKSDEQDAVGRNILVPYLREKGINHLDLVILTHPHDDHVGGLTSVMDKFDVSEVLDSGQAATSVNYLRFLKTIERKKIPYRIGRAGQVIDFGGGVKGYVLSPSDPLIEGTLSDLNNNSIVIRLVYGNTSFLLMGDAAFEAEDRIMLSGAEVRSNVMKIGHHGSSTSTSSRFLEKVAPQYAVISVGAHNQFGHPAGATLEKLADQGVKVFRTDLNGSVKFISDGSRIIVQPAKL